MDSNQPKDLDYSFSEIRKYASGVHFLNPGIESAHISKFEKEFGVILPTAYKMFLQAYNGGELFRPGTVLAEINDENTEQRIAGKSYLDEYFLEARQWPGMPKGYLIIADMNYGDAICIKLVESEVYDSKVIQWDVEGGVVSRSWNGFIEWLEDCLEEGSMFVNYDGSEKDPDFL